MIIDLLLDTGVWDGQRIVENAKQAGCLMDQIVNGINNNNEVSIKDAACKLKLMHKE